MRPNAGSPKGAARFLFAECKMYVKSNKMGKKTKGFFEKHIAKTHKACYIYNGRGFLEPCLRPEWEDFR